MQHPLIFTDYSFLHYLWFKDNKFWLLHVPVVSGHLSSKNLIFLFNLHYNQKYYFSLQCVSITRELLSITQLLKPTITYMFAQITPMWKFILFLTDKPLLFKTSLINIGPQCLHTLFQTLRTPSCTAEHIKSTFIIKYLNIIIRYDLAIFCKTNENPIKPHQITNIARHNTITDIFSF